MKKKYTAFSLAEVLITLSIIGIIAAMTLPAIVGKYKKVENETRLKKAYTVLSQALLMSVAKDCYLSTDNFKDGNQDSINSWYKYYLKPYIKVMKECYNEAGCWHGGSTHALNGSVVTYDRGAIGIGYGIVNFLTIDGAAVNLDGYEPTDAYNRFGVKSNANSVLVFYVDINAKKNPNVIGKDIFIYVFTEKGLIPAGNDMTTDEINANCSLNSTGNFCSAKIMQNNWQFGDENL